ncbi:MAG: hypothetical protein AMXMBFR13_34240 [Phycisphaerae bacterium]
MNVSNRSRRAAFTALAVSVVVAVATLVSLAPTMGQGREPALSPQRKRLAAAQHWHELLARVRQASTFSVDPETRYLWSRRLMESEIGVKSDASSRSAAITAHVERMKALEAEAEAGHRQGTLPALEKAATSYYRAEAEVLLAELKQ